MLDVNRQCIAACVADGRTSLNSLQRLALTLTLEHLHALGARARHNPCAAPRGATTAPSHGQGHSPRGGDMYLHVQITCGCAAPRVHARTTIGAGTSATAMSVVMTPCTSQGWRPISVVYQPASVATQPEKAIGTSAQSSGLGRPSTAIQ